MQYPHRIIPHGHDPSDEAPLGLIIAIPIFLCLNIILAVIGARWMNRLSHDTSEDVLTAHYLGGRSFGPWLSLGTMFASLFSGFTVIGIPNGAYYHGWIELERIAYVAMLTFVFSGAAVRLRKASLVRNHQTPSDFITDMFQSQLLRYAIIVIQLLSQFIWMTSNVLAVKNAFNGAFKLDPDNPWFTIGVVAFILISEWFGGLSAVALTDSVQGVIMIFGAVSVTCVIKYYWGGWVALDPSTFPSPEFYQTPTKNQQWIWFQLTLLTVSQAFYPVTIQRIYAASSLEGVRMGALTMFAGPWVATIGSIFIGTMGVQILGESCSTLPGKSALVLLCVSLDEVGLLSLALSFLRIPGVSEQEACMTPDSPFAAIMEQLMSIGGFPEVSAVILYTSALAAIMSTTDSVLISISQIITSDILYPMRPNATPKQVAWAGRIVSLVVSILALALGLLWKGSIILLFDLSLPISVQMVPAFLIGLYSKYRPHPWSLAIPTWGGMLASILITIWWEHDSLHDAVFVFLLNFGAMLLCELGRLMWNRKLRFNMAVLRNLHNTKAKAKSLDLDDDEEDHQDPYPNRPEWDKPKVKRFGVNSLSPKLLEAMMLGMQEPIKNYQYVLLMLLSVSITGKSAFVLFYHELLSSLFFIFTNCETRIFPVPLTPESLPALDDGVFTILPATFRGLPWWAFKAIILIFISSLLTLPIILEMPKDYPFDKNALLKSGVEADIVELEPEEKGTRTMFDEVNQHLKSRRELIREQTTRIKAIKKDAYDVAEQKRLDDESSKSATAHLNTLVKEPTRRTMPIFESQWKLMQTNEGVDEEDDVDDEKEVNYDVEGRGEDKFVDNEVE